MAEPQYKTIDKFDRLMGELAGLPDVAKVKPSTRAVHLPLIGSTQTYIVQTIRQREVGDYIFLQYLDDTGSVRLVVPPEVAEAIASQRDALTKKNRKAAAKERARADKAAGKLPGFLQPKGKKGRKKAAARKGAIVDDD